MPAAKRKPGYGRRTKTTYVRGLERLKKRKTKGKTHARRS